MDFNFKSICQINQDLNGHPEDTVGKIKPALKRYIVIMKSEEKEHPGLHYELHFMWENSVKIRCESRQTPRWDTSNPDQYRSFRIHSLHKLL